MTDRPGRTAGKRLLFILQHCPALLDATFAIAQRQLLSGRDTALYEKAVNLYSSKSKAKVPLPTDKTWIEQTNRKNENERNKLEVELKTYSSNMIKESIRVSLYMILHFNCLNVEQMAHRDLGDYYSSVGDTNTSLKHYAQSREFCSTSQHVLDMCISILEVSLDANPYDIDIF